jgi:hypothetical protein
MKDYRRMQNLRLCLNWASAKEISVARKVSVTSIRVGLKNLIAIGHMEREVVKGIPQRGTPFQHRYRTTRAGQEWLTKTEVKPVPPPEYRRKHTRLDQQVDYVPVDLTNQNLYNPFEWRTYVQPFASQSTL